MRLLSLRICDRSACGYAIAQPADMRLLSLRICDRSACGYAIAQPADMRLLSLRICDCSACGYAIAQPADMRLLSLRYAIAQPADAGGGIEPGVERFSAEPQDLTPKTIKPADAGDSASSQISFVVFNSVRI
jgi:hypothetical protein